MSETTTQPATDATSLKRFFKARFGIPVRVRSLSGKAGWVEVWIPSLPRQKGEPFNAPIRYAAEFPDDLGDRCAEIVYPGKGWRWCGNIGRCGIALLRSQWETLILQYSQPAAGGPNETR